MVPTDAEAQIEAQRVRRDEKTIQPGTDTDRSTGVGRTSIEAGSESISVDRDDRSRRNLINECGQASTGKIVNQLILKVTDEIAEFEELIVQRREYLKELTEISKQLREASENLT